MNENYPLKLLTNFSCTNCKSQFIIKDVMRAETGFDFSLKNSRCPMLLQCGHTVCNHCLHQNVKGTNSFTCQLCGFVSSWELSSENFIKSFSFNFHMLGNIIVFQNSRLEKDRKLAFLSKNNGDFNYVISGQSNVTLKTGSNDSVCEECSLKALWHCENCKSNFCEICWSKVHNFAKSLTKHFKTAINEVSRNGFKKCTEHETQNLEFFCTSCSKVVCSHCVILQHQGEGHHAITLKEKNLEMVNKLKTVAEDADKINKRMKQTLEELKLKKTYFESPDRTSYPDFESQITRNFSRIHGILQLEEERLLKALRDKSNERENCFKALQTQLEKQVETVENLLHECDVTTKNPYNSDLTDLHRQLTEVQNLPCYLISNKIGDSDNEKLEFDEKLIDSLRDYCKMNLPSNESFELRSALDLPEGYAVDPLNFPLLDETPKEGVESNLSSVIDFESVSDCSSREDSEAINVLKSGKEPKIFLERRSYCVRISFIKNPGEFYVTLNSQRLKQKAIDKQASMVARLSSNVPKTFEKGEIYLVKYNVDKKWYRGRIMEVMPSKRAGAEDSVLVYYLDYGNFETVPISRLKPIPLDLLEEPPLAIKCKLFDCVPQEAEWCEESTKTMEKILKNHTATMFVMKVLTDCLEVDLSVIYPEGQIGRDIVSVRDALLFLGFSSFVHGFKVPRNATAFKYLDQCLPSVGETFDVTVTHVNSPSDFFVQKKDQDSYLRKLATDLQSYYADNWEKGMIYNPVLDMPCAALYSADQRWYRAKIVDVPCKKMVTVFYVDYGNRETIEWTQIRKLKENFAKCPPLAFNCSLAGIFAINGSPWSSQSKTYLKKSMLMREGRVIVQGKAKQKLKVLLLKKGAKKYICVNASFAEMGMAVKSRDSDCLWMLSSLENEENIIKNMERKLIEEGDKMQTSPDSEKGLKDLIKGRKKNKLSAKELREQHESEKKNHAEESGEPAENKIDDYKVFKVKVDILSAETPSNIYVTFPTLMEEFENLQAKLNEFYQDSTGSVENWKVGSVCAVLDSVKGSWYRASILSLLPNDQVQVFLKDVARVTTEPVSALRTLDPIFKQFSTCAIKCHLADIRPPGDNWPGISSEYFVEELDNHKEVYMTKRGQAKNGSLPVELWVQKVLSRGALEPIKKEWVTLNRMLVHQGLAVPLKPEIWAGMEASTEEEEYSDEKKSTDNNDVESIEHSFNVTNIPEAFIPSLNSGWMPPLPLDRSHFIGIPTYVDSNAYIYIYDVERDEDKLKMIREVLLQQYENSSLTPEDHFWIPGQMCIVRYHIDNFWYRGLILKEYEDMTYDVLFVDYGNVEVCQVADLRKRIKMHDIPILTHQFQLHGIRSVSKNGEWPDSITDIIHSLIVEKKCEVDVLKYPKNPSESYTITLKVIESGVDIAMYLVEKNLALLDITESDIVFPDNEPLLLPSELSHDSPVLRYVPLVIPDNCNQFFVEITKVYSETEFFANVVIDASLPSKLQKVLNEFKSLQEVLKNESFSQPAIENLTEGGPCCCLDFMNNVWCRGEIESFVKNSVCVSFVDYGTKESLHKDFLRKCKDSWMTLPKMAVKFKLGGVEKCENVSESAYMKALTDRLNGTLYVEILKRHEQCFEVRLLDKENGPLAYQGMIDEGLMKFI